MSELELPLPEVAQLADEIGEFICFWGFKKIHGRLWTYIYLSKTPLDAGQLIKLLNVSKALMSLTLNDLLRFNVIFENGKSERGTMTYVANTDIIEIILNVFKRREKKMLLKIHTAFQGLAARVGSEPDKKNGVLSDRLTTLGKIIEQAQSALESILQLSSIDLAAWEEIQAASKK